MSLGTSVVPLWFQHHRGRLLASVSTIGMVGLAVFYTQLAINPPGRLPYSILLLLTVLSVALLVHGILTNECWSVRKGAGLATIMWAVQIATIGYGEVLGLLLFQSRWTSASAILIDFVPLFLAGWLYWVAGHGDGCESV